MIPLRLAPRGRLPLGVERLDLRIGKEVRPPPAREDVIGGGAERLASRDIRAARAVGDHLVREAHLGIRPMHRDVILQMGVGHEEIRLRGGHAGQQRLEVRGIQFEGLFHRDREVSRVRLQVVVDPLRVVLPVLGILEQECNLQRLLELPRGDQRAQEIHLRRRQDVHRGQGPEDPLAAAVDAPRARAAGDVRNAVALGHDALRLDQV